MEARSSCPRADPKDLGDLGEGQPGEEVEDDHRPVRRGEHGEGPLQRVPIGERTRGIIDAGLQIEEMHLAGVSPSTILCVRAAGSAGQAALAASSPGGPMAPSIRARPSGVRCS